jgi:RsiW-degrading membrane proteinase PrsW (M82 family)
MPLPVVLAAVGFTIVWAALLWALAGRSRALFGLIVLGVVLGSLGAALPASFLNQVLLEGLTRTFGDIEARRVVIGTFAPAIEEVSKGFVLAALVLILPTLSSTSILTVSLAIGLGFGLVESMQYILFGAVQGGTEGILRAVWVRGVLGAAHHPTFVALTGMGLAFSRKGPRWWPCFWVGLAIAIGHHMLWNAVSAGYLTELLCGATEPGGVCNRALDPVRWLVLAPALVAITLAPGWLAVGAAVRLLRTR